MPSVIQTKNPELAAPPARRLLREIRIASDISRMAVTLARQTKSNIGNGQRVICVPGFGGGDSYTYWLRRFLNQNGYRAEGWNLGVNRGGAGLRGDIDYHPIPEKYRNTAELEVPRMAMKLREQVRKRSDETGDTFVLVGHSLGGYLAREVARQLPNHVSQLITFGSPIYGGPKYTAAASVFIRRGLDMDWVESIIEEREQIPIEVPLTTIISPSDAIVGYQCSIDRHQLHAKLIEVDANHVGMAFNPTIWKLVLEELQLSKPLAAASAH